MNVSVQQESKLSLSKLIMLVFRQMKLEVQGSEVRLNNSPGEFETFFMKIKEEFQKDFPCLQNVHFVTTGTPWSHELAQALGQLYSSREFSYDDCEMVLRPLRTDAEETQARGMRSLGRNVNRFEELVKRFEEIKRRP